MELNKRVDFSTAKLLKEKGFDEKCSHYYINDFQNFKHDGKLYKTSLPNDWDNENIFQYVKRTNQFHLCNAPTIAEAVMWLYKKHGLWISVWEFTYKDGLKVFKNNIIIYAEYNHPTEAYEAAISYTLKNLVK